MTGTITVDWVQMLMEMALILFFLVGLVALVLGLILLLSPGYFERLSRILSRPFSGRRAMKSLEVPRYQEPLFYRHHLWTGGLILTGALFFLFSLVFRFSLQEAVMVLPGMDWIWLGVLWALILGNLVAAVIGLVILLRPSLLKPLEASANRWVSLRQMSRPLSTSHNMTDQLAGRYPRASGLLLLLGGLFLVATFGLLLS